MVFIGMEFSMNVIRKFVLSFVGAAIFAGNGALALWGMIASLSIIFELRSEVLYSDGVHYPKWMIATAVVVALLHVIFVIAHALAMVGKKIARFIIFSFLLILFFANLHEVIMSHLHFGMIRPVVMNYFCCLLYLGWDFLNYYYWFHLRGGNNSAVSVSG